MLHIAICDDSSKDLTNISAHTKRYLTDHALEAEVVEFSHPDALLTACKKVSFTLFLLDIIMPMLTGIDIGRELRRAHNEAPIIYFSTSDEFAVDAFAVQASHYLTKPFSNNSFDEAIHRALACIDSAAAKFLTVKCEGGDLINININDIQYIKSRNHDQQLYLTKGICSETRRSLSRLSEELEKLSPGQFISPYKGYVVNQHAIISIGSKDILLRNGEKIPIPRGTFRELQAQYVDFCFEKMGGIV